MISIYIGSQHHIIPIVGSVLLQDIRISPAEKFPVLEH